MSISLPALLVLSLSATAAAATDQAALPTVFLTLEEPSTVTVWRRAVARGDAPAAATAAAVTQLHRNLSEQEGFLRLLADSGLDAPAVFSLQRLANGVAVVARAEDVASLRALPGVRSVHTVALLRKGNRFSADYLGATAAWGAEVPLTGAGMRIGIIDTGVDYLHADFGGPGADADYEGDDPEVLEEGSFPTGKVVGGWDFAGTEYGYSLEEDVPDSLVPKPDPDPMDLDGHGTHVAGTAAGYGVDGDGEAWTGPWDLSLDMESFRIGPGMAPEADLYALKVFGDTKYATASALTTAALEWALDPDGDGDFEDRLDVVNISLGADYGIGGGYEVEVYTNAVAAGLVVVAAAGNAWNVQFVTSDPCAVEGVICVASCHHDGVPYPGLRVEAPESLKGIYLARPSNFGPELSDEEDLTAGLVLAEPSDGCAPLVDADAVGGAIAVMDRGDCKYWEKVTAAQDAGAVGAIVVNNQGGIPPKMKWNGDTVTIPSVIMRQVDGELLKAALGDGTPVSVTLRKGLTAYVDDKTGWIAGSSSRGPTRRAGRIRLKPDLTAPGANITSAAALSGDGGSSKSGTSMASPAAAGVMALLRQARPQRTPAELKAWAMSTAAADVIRSPGEAPLSTTRQGAGRIDAARALAADLYAYDLDHPQGVGLSFDALDVIESVEEQRTVRVENRSDASRSFAVTYEPTVDVPGAEVLLPDGPDLVVPAGESVDFAVVLAADPADLRHVRSPNLGATAGKAKLHRSYFAEETGYLVFRDGEDAAAVLRVPVLAGPRPASEMHVGVTGITLRGVTGTGALDLAGTHVAPDGSGPEAVRSLVTPFELKLESPDEDIGDATYVTGSFTAEEVQAAINVADLRAVGITSDYGAQIRDGAGVAETTLYLALAVWAPWGSPVEAFFLVEYDRDGDRAADGFFINRYDADAFFVKHYLPGDDEGQRVGRINEMDPHRGTIPVHMCDVMILPMPASNLGLTAEDAETAFRITTFHVHHHGAWSLVDATDWFRHDPTRQVFDFQADRTGMPFFPDMDGAEVPYAWDAGGIHSPGLMLVHHHNPTGERLDLLDVAGPGCWRPEDCAEGMVCVPTLGHCVACVSSDDCGLGEYCDEYTCVEDCAREDANICPAGYTCDAQTGRCGECVYNDQCPEGTWCDPGALRCVECITSWECGPGEHCAPRHGVCEPDCRLPSSNECPDAHPWCNQATGLCADCIFDAHCTGGTVCDEWATWTCVTPPWEPAADTTQAEPAAEVVEDAGGDAARPTPAGRGCAAGPVAAPRPPAILIVALLLLWRARQLQAVKTGQISSSRERTKNIACMGRFQRNQRS